MIVTLRITVKLLASQTLRQKLSIEVLPLEPIGYITSMYPDTWILLHKKLPSYATVADWLCETEGHCLLPLACFSSPFHLCRLFPVCPSLTFLHILPWYTFLSLVSYPVHCSSALPSSLLCILIPCSISGRIGFTADKRIAVCNYLVLFIHSVELLVIMQICRGQIFVLEDIVLVLRICKDTL